nr:HYR domain-containing protein [uncultured Draconibacterium sp.]
MRTVTEKNIILPFFRKIGNCILPNAKTITLFVGFFLLFLFNQQVSFGQTTRTLTFTSPGTWTVPADVTEITVEAWGAGGAGGGSTSNDAGGGSGGGGGGYCINVFTVTPGQTINYTVGAGGTGSNGNGTSGDTTLILSLQANGGGGGGANMGAIGSGGTASGGTTNITGGSGLKGKRNTGGNGGTGASGGAGGNGVSNGKGESGRPPGGGGGGGEARGATQYAGGNGADGQIKITYTSSLPDGFWYKADAGVSGINPVTTWVDQSGNNNNATNTGTVLLENNSINFNPSLSFTNVIRQFVTANNAAPLRLIVVTKPTGTNDLGGLIGVGPGSVTDKGIRQGNGIGGTSVAGDSWLGDNNNDDWSFNGTSRINGSSSYIHNYRWHIVNQSRASALAASQYYLGGYIDAWDGPRFYTGNIAEVMAYSSKTSPSDGIVESYLAIKYGISLPGNYYASDGTTTWASTSGYQNDVHGIGRDNSYGLNQLSSKSENPGTDILTIQSGNSFVTPTNAQTGTALNDKQFFIAGHNNGSTSTVSTLSAGINTIARKWYAQTTNMLLTESFQFNLSGTNFGAYCKIGVLIADNAALTTNRRFVEGTLSSSTLTVNDLAITGNKYFTVATLADTEAPVANCKSDLTVYLNANGEAAITPEMLDNGSTDDCGIDTMWVSPEILSCPSSGIESGSSGVYSASVATTDGATVTITLSNFDIIPNTTNCISSYNYDISFDYIIEYSGTNSLTLWTKQLDFLIDDDPFDSQTRVIGTVSSVTTTNNQTRKESDCNTVTFSDLVVNSISWHVSGNYITEQTITLQEESSNSSSQNVTLTVTDNSGNISTCQTTVTVSDTIKPTINCPASVTDEVDVGFDYATNVDLGELAATDTTDNCTIESATNNAPLQFPLGNTDVVWTVTDVSGNTATCTQLVTIIARDTVDMWVEQPGPTCNAAEGTINSSGIDTTTVVTFNVKMETNKTTWSPDWEIKFTLAPSNNTNPGDVPTIKTVASVGSVGNLSVSGGVYTLTNIPSTNGEGVVSISMNLVGNRYANLDVDFIITEAKEIDSNIQDKDSDDWQVIQTVNAIPNTGPITTN